MELSQKSPIKCLYDSRFVMYFRDGLSNRLRLLAGYMVVAERVYNTSHIVMVWELNSACVGHFLEIFHPLENVTFISASERPLFEVHAIEHFGPSYAGFLELIRRFNLDTDPEHWHSIRKAKYSLLKPVSHVKHEVLQFVKSHHICNCIGVHVRHTDLDSHQSVKNTNHTSNIPFLQFIDSFPSNQCIYLMTDNPVTQHIFQRHYGASRLFVYASIKETSIHREANHRFTSLFHTIVDVLISAYTFDFKGSVGSSLSELVWLMNVTYVNQTRIPTTCTNMEDDDPYV